MFIDSVRQSHPDIHCPHPHRSSLGIKRLVHLQSTLDTLHKPQKSRDDEHQDGDPERVPALPVAPVVPPLRDGRGRGLVKGLLEYHQPVPPVPEVLNLPLLGAEHAQAAAKSRINLALRRALGDELAQPLPLVVCAALQAAEDCLWEEQGDGLLGFVDEAGREDVAVYWVS